MFHVAASVRFQPDKQQPVTEHLVPSHGTKVTLTWPPCIFPPATIVIQTPVKLSGEKYKLIKMYKHISAEYL